nr:MAG TPA: hypothetical protein [Crassvirales sp.]DAW07334.1 MAG TPA: hypothetical protein [Caudoviricetes sp.]
MVIQYYLRIQYDRECTQHDLDEYKAESTHT